MNHDPCHFDPRYFAAQTCPCSHECALPLFEAAMEATRKKVREEIFRELAVFLLLPEDDESDPEKNWEREVWKELKDRNKHSVDMAKRINGWNAFRDCIAYALGLPLTTSRLELVEAIKTLKEEP